MTIWRPLAQRALASAHASGAEQVEYVEGATLHEARNEGMARLGTEWVVHLDGDDELEPGYLDTLRAGTADVRAPAVRYVHGTSRRSAPPAMPRVWSHLHNCIAECLPLGNWLVVGAMARVDLLREVGGWRDFPWSEDWDLWLRCHLAGATFEAIPDAVYTAHRGPVMRNRALPQSERLRVHGLIAAANGIGMDGKPVNS
jgi:GT2 family glycosyltransferase